MSSSRHFRSIRVQVLAKKVLKIRRTVLATRKRKPFLRRANGKLFVSGWYDCSRCCLLLLIPGETFHAPRMILPRVYPRGSWLARALYRRSKAGKTEIRGAAGITGGEGEERERKRERTVKREARSSRRYVRATASRQVTRSRLLTVNGAMNGSGWSPEEKGGPRRMATTREKESRRRRIGERGWPPAADRRTEITPRR